MIKESKIYYVESYPTIKIINSYFILANSSLYPPFDHQKGPI
jgi:hypothetical protein